MLCFLLCLEENQYKWHEHVGSWIRNTFKVCLFTCQSCTFIWIICCTKEFMGWLTQILTNGWSGGQGEQALLTVSAMINILDSWILVSFRVNFLTLFQLLQNSSLPNSCKQILFLWAKHLLFGPFLHKSQTCYPYLTIVKMLCKWKSITS